MAILIPIDNVRLPGDVESEMVAPLAGMWSTTRIRLDGGGTQANQNWADPLRQYEVKIGACDAEDLEAIRVMAIARRGLRGFLLKDWSDFHAEESELGTGDGNETDFPLVKVYDDTVLPYVRRITRPVTASIEVFLDGTPAAFTLVGGDTVRFSVAPGIGVEVTASFDFLVPVMFSNDIQTVRVIHGDLIDTDSITLEEVQDAS